MSGKPTRRLAETIHGIERLATGHALTPQLRRVVLPDYIEFEDSEGNKVGEYENGEYRPRNGPKPPVASLPIVTADGPFVRVRWDGLWGDPMDPRHNADPDIRPAADVTFLEIHMSLDPEFAPDRARTYAGGFDAKGPGGDTTVGPLVEGGTYWVGFRARSAGGRLGDLSGLVDIEVSGLNIDNGLFDLALKADEVRESADGKNSVYYQDTPPQPRPRLDGEGNEIYDEDGNQVVIPHKDGDLWFDTSVDEDGRQSNMPHVWSDADGWVSAADGRVDAVQSAVDDLESDLDVVRESADGKSKITWSPDAPSGEGEAGDTWFRTSGDSIIGYWRHSGSSWVSMSLDATVIPNLDAGKITSGFIDSERIAAGSVTADKLLIESGANLLPDQAIAQAADFGPWSVVNGRLELTGTGEQVGGYWTQWSFEVVPGERIHASFTQEADTPGITSLHVAWQVIRDGGWVLGPLVSYVSGAGEASGSALAPPGALRGCIGLYVEGDVPSGAQKRVAGLRVRRMTGSTLIADGAITTDKIAAGAITAESGIIGSLDAGVITTGELRGELIRAQSIASEALAADAIDGKTITGATIQTSAAGQRVVMDGSGLVQYNSLNQVIMDARNGRFSTVGNISTGMSDERRVILDNEVWGSGAGIIMAPDGSAPAARHGSRVGSPDRRWIEIAAEENERYSGARSRGRFRESDLELLYGRLYNSSESGRFSRLYFGDGSGSSTGFSKWELGSGMVTSDNVRTDRTRIAGDYSNVSVSAYNGSITLSAGSTITIDAQSDLRLRHGGDLQIYDVPVYTGTTGGIHWKSGPTMVRDASSRRHKLSIESLTDTDPMVGEKLLSVDARTWFDRSSAEALAEYHDSVLEGSPDEQAYDRIEPLRRIPGVIAEELHDAGLEMFVVYDEEGRPDAVAYERIGPALIPVIRDLRDRIIELEERMRGN